jgi:hypothetical protein
MRSIPEALRAKMQLLAQTPANNSDPRQDVIISRHSIPLPDYKLWQTSTIDNYTASRVSIAVSRPDYRRMPQTIYTAGIDGSTAKIHSAIFDGANVPKSWSTEMNIPNVSDISLAFVGRFRPYKRRTEFYTTEERPWIFWIDTDANLYARYWDDESTLANLGANATSCAATMGINSVQNEWGYGLLVAWTTTAGAVFYAQYFDGQWSDGITVTQAPQNATEVTISRTADWRIIMLVKNSSGATTALFFRSIAISMSNYEKVELLNTGISNAAITEVNYSEGFGSEQVEITSTEIAAAKKYSILAPTPHSAYNIDDSNGNYGRFIMLEFYDDVYGSAASDFTIKGTSGSTYGGLAVVRPEGKDLNWLLIEFQDFNNAPGDCTITYIAGTLSSGVAAALNFTIVFTPTGLVPVVTDPPVLVSIINIGEVDENA